MTRLQCVVWNRSRSASGPEERGDMPRLYYGELAADVLQVTDPQVCYLIHRSHKILRQAFQDLARDLGGDDLAKLAGLFAVAAEGDVAAAADEQLVIDRAVVPLLRRAAAELDGAAIDVGFNDADRLQQVSEFGGQRFADAL